MTPRGPEQLWESDAPAARALRAALAPLGWAFGGVVKARAALYDSGALSAHRGPIPAIAVGNLSVGGTGKTPVAAWIAGEARRRGARPAIVLRGYGDDEPLVHETLNPGVAVVVSPDRVAGVARAAGLGATVAVLDDAFQHRRAARAVDVVLVSADRWHPPVRLLPAGPWREPLSALRRATLALVTRKAAPRAAADDVRAVIAEAAPGVPSAIAWLAPGELREVGGDATRPLDSLRGARVLAVSAIGDPAAFAAQLAAAGAEVEPRAFADHHAYTDADVAALAARAASVDAVVCTLKDAVKLRGRWPAGASPLWYVSQRVVVEHGRDQLERALDGVLPPDHPTPAPPASAGLNTSRHGH